MENVEKCGRMTDNDIIKAWENEIHLAEYVDSDYCSNVEISLIKETINAFNRQKADIERLQSEIGSLNKKYPCTVDVGNNCLVYARSFDDYDKLIADIAAEAVKEFAERLKAEIPKEFDYGLCYTFCVGIDNLVKEMEENK